ncbi:3-isopropylmalate dehydratase [Paenibacillus sp. FSL R5-0527]|uniref:3-isopropylmalate dehydratase n=1 Tax=Paenibacillus sp. FSL R5-0527 TaxID=2975321 RepID=UPI000979D227|nr:hypothetical protein BK140_17005 [Paenibacillus macerans]
MNHEITEETKAINAALKIVKLKDRRFDLDKHRYIMVSGYVLEHPTLGVFGFKDTEYPYQPVGAKEALKSIIEQGGFVSFKDARWWK